MTNVSKGGKKKLGHRDVKRRGEEAAGQEEGSGGEAAAKTSSRNVGNFGKLQKCKTEHSFPVQVCSPACFWTCLSISTEI